MPSLIAFCLLFVEASIYITYYKDCIFAFVILLTFMGMMWVNIQYKGKGADWFDTLLNHSIEQEEVSSQEKLLAIPDAMAASVGNLFNNL